MEASITYSIKSIDWDPANPVVISNISCQLSTRAGGHEYVNGFYTSLEFLDPHDPTFINIREMLEAGRKEDAFPYLIDFAKQSLNAKSVLPFSERELTHINSQIDKMTQEWVDAGLDEATVESRKASTLNGMKTSLRPSTQHLEAVSIEQLQCMVDGATTELRTEFA